MEQVLRHWQKGELFESNFNFVKCAITAAEMTLWPVILPICVCVCVCACCSCRLWLSTEMPLSLCSFSPSGDGVWLAVAARLLAACLFCLQLFHLEETDAHVEYKWMWWVRGKHWLISISTTNSCLDSGGFFFSKYALICLNTFIVY